MIPLQLTPEQLRAIKRGADTVELSPDQAATVRGRLNRAKRTSEPSGGRPRTHVCSDPAKCRVCYLRRWRADKRNTAE